MSDTPLRTCACCRQDLPIEQFYLKNHHTGLRHCYCKPCMNRKRKERRSSGLERHRPPQEPDNAFAAQTLQRVVDVLAQAPTQAHTVLSLAQALSIPLQRLRQILIDSDDSRLIKVWQGGEHQPRWALADRWIAKDRTRRPEPQPGFIAEMDHWWQRLQAAVAAHRQHRDRLRARV